MTAKAVTRQQTISGKRWFYLNIGLGIALILAGVAALFWLGQPAPAVNSATNPAQDRVAADFSLLALSGQSMALSDYRGQVVLVNTWATWCPPCKAEMPTLNAYYEANKDKGFVVLAVNVQEDADTVGQFIKANGFTFPVLLDTQAKVLNQYNIVGLPTSLIIDREGIIRTVHTGEITQQQLDKVVGPLF